MNIKFKIATQNDSEIIAQLVLDLTQEICLTTKANHFDIDLNSTVERCRELMSKDHYGAILGFNSDKPVALSTFTETYALYAGGKIGVIPEFYVAPEFRSSGIGEALITRIKEYGKQHDWSCIELCTPPLPEFQRTLDFYQRNGLAPVGGRKMRGKV